MFVLVTLLICCYSFISLSLMPPFGLVSPNAGWLLGRCPRLHVPCVGLCPHGKGGLGGMWGVPMARFLGQGALCFLGITSDQGHCRTSQVHVPVSALVWRGHFHAQAGGGAASSSGTPTPPPPAFCAPRAPKSGSCGTLSTSALCLPPSV